MLRVSNLTKSFLTDHGPVRAVRGVSFVVETGQFFTLLGPSGCGKTTTLQCIAGLETPDAGEIVMDDDCLFSTASRTSMPAHRRNLGMVFQSYAIWPHMTVYDNVAFPLVYGHGRTSKRDVRELVMRVLALVKLESMAERPAPFLSGGQQQRVALARALVHEPRLLLFDEPLSNLDAKLREEMRVEIRQLTEKLGITTVYVTHDQTEALAMSDLVAVMREGVIVQSGSPREVYLKPLDAFAADFMGSSNIIPGIVAKAGEGDILGLVGTAIGPLACAIPSDCAPGGGVQVIVRPESFRILTKNSDTCRKHNVFKGRIEHVVFIGDSLEAQVRVGDQLLRVKTDPFVEIAVSETIQIEIPVDRCIAIPGTGIEPSSVAGSGKG